MTAFNELMVNLHVVTGEKEKNVGMWGPHTRTRCSLVSLYYLGAPL